MKGKIQMILILQNQINKNNNFLLLLQVRHG